MLHIATSYVAWDYCTVKETNKTDLRAGEKGKIKRLYFLDSRIGECVHPQLVQNDEISDFNMIFT